jgi:hypothetical protein
MEELAEAVSFLHPSQRTEFNFLVKLARARRIQDEPVREATITRLRAEMESRLARDASERNDPNLRIRRLRQERNG